MTRPNPLFLALALVGLCAVLAWAGLAKGAIYTGKHEGDTMHLMQIVLREARGEWPHLDFQTPIGVLATAPIALFIWLGNGIGHAFLYAQTLVALVALPAIWWVALSRFRGALAYVFGALVLILILALVHGQAERSVSISMHYNRWAWAAAFLAIACAIVPPPEGRRAALADGVVIGGALAAMALLKMTYFGAFLLPIVIALATRRAWTSLAVAGLTGLAVALAVTLLAGTPGFWLAYLKDLLTVMGSQVRARPGEPFISILGAPSFMGGNLVLLGGVILLRLAGRMQEGLVLLLLAPGFAYVTFQNFGNDPQWIWLLALLLIALRPEAPVTVPVFGDARQAMLLAGVAAAAFAMPSLLNLAYSPYRHLATDTSEYTPLLPRDPLHHDLQTATLRVERIDALIALDVPGQPFAETADPDDPRDDTTDFMGENWEKCTVERGVVTWYDTLAEDLVASGLVEGKTLFAADLLSPYWLYGAGEPLPGASPWFYGGLPGWAAADYLLVPLCPLSTSVRKLILDAVEETVEETGTPLTEVRRNAYYVLYEK